MQLTPYLTFNGQCQAAFKFYQQCLGGQIELMMTHGDSPIADQVPPEWHELILHARLVVKDAVLFGSDNPPSGGGSSDSRIDDPERARGMHVALHVDDPAEAERIFNAFAENGAIKMPLQKTFWADCFGMVLDRFGTPWMINGGRGT